MRATCTVHGGEMDRIKLPGISIPPSIKLLLASERQTDTAYQKHETGVQSEGEDLHCFARPRCAGSVYSHNRPPLHERKTQSSSAYWRPTTRRALRSATQIDVGVPEAK